MHPIFIAIILGIVEGLTEFLPVSSTGHLILVNEFIKFSPQFTELFDIFIQLGAILAVVVYFWKKLCPFGLHKTVEEKKQTMTLWGKTIVGLLPAILIGGLFANDIERLLFHPVPVAIALLVGGIILILIERRKPKHKILTVESLGYFTVLGIGFIQCLAMIPGTSRSGATIIGAMLLGASRLVATEFSFFLAIPTMCAASLHALLKVGFSMTQMEFVALITGFFTAFIVALVIIDVFLKYISKHDFKFFGVYRIILGVIVLGYFYWR